MILVTLKKCIETSENWMQLFVKIINKTNNGT